MLSVESDRRIGVIMTCYTSTMLNSLQSSFCYRARERCLVKRYAVVVVVVTHVHSLFTSYLGR